MENWAFQFIKRLAHEVWFSVGRTLGYTEHQFLTAGAYFLSSGTRSWRRVGSPAERRV